LTYRPFILNICVVVVLTVAVESSALAIDCSRATGSVETAICADKDLRKADDIFNRGYSSLIDRVDRRQRLELIESQKRWLIQRDATCTGRLPADVAACVDDLSRRRQQELVDKFSDGVRFGGVRLGRPGQSVLVGHEKLDVVGPREDMLNLVHGNTLIAESEAPFEIDGRGGDESGEAIVVSTHDNGNLGCSEQYLVSSLPNRPLRVETLDGRDNCSRSFLVRKKGTSLELTLDASPGRNGVVKRWSPESGQVVHDRRLEFSPKHGTTMADFHDNASPTDIEEFFDSLKRAAPRDWRSMAEALQYAFVRSDDADNKYVVLSPCSGSRGCPSESAFAAYATATKSFFFAYELPNSKLGRDRAGVIYFPDRAKWPADLSQIIRKWSEGEMRDNAN